MTPKKGERSNRRAGKFESIPEADEFLADIFAVCEKHGFGIEHEDTGGAFIIVPWKECDWEWMEAAAFDALRKEPTK